MLRYCNLVNDWTENVSLRAIKQRTNEPVEAYAGRFYAQIGRMGKNPDDCTPDFVQGLLPELRVAVFMQRPENADETIKYAKLAEICNIKKNAEEVALVEVAEDALRSDDPIQRKAQLLHLDDSLKQIKESIATLKTPSAAPSEEINAFQPGNNQSGQRNNSYGQNQRGNQNRNGNRNNQSRRNGNNNSRAPFRNNQNGQRFNGICNHCGIYGHKWRECKRRLSGQPGGNNSQNQNYNSRPQNNGPSNAPGPAQVPINVHMPPLYSGQASNYPPPGQQRIMMVEAYPAHPPAATSVPQITYEPSVASMGTHSQQ